ncbi:MAG: DNA phosphorothioation-associated putative methyltransferase [Myxococcales bacterium]|nr:DNA phosphorothioation-associated putative methyltransferase [Myxococcales bacterium]
MEPTLPDGSTYRCLVAALTSGKRLPEAVYFHRDLLSSIPESLQVVAAHAAALAQVESGAWNVIKFASSSRKVSLLAYPAFFDAPFPTLHAAWTVDVETSSVRFRDYAQDANPPVLHRKERLLPVDHPAVPAFAQLTATAERLGLFDDVATIGLLRGWTERLQSCGVRLDGHTLTTAGPSTDGPRVERHRTALRRRGLSTPVQLLARHGYLDGSLSLFDYGCGRGDDVTTLQERGLVAAGWDPHFAPDEPKREADLVNLGFVLNVIEDLDERREALVGAYALATRLLVVAALLGGRMAIERRRLFRDGVLTQRGTFQKYYAQGELRSYLEQTLGREPIAVAPGVFFVFRSDEDEQRFLAGRQSRPAIHTPPRPAPRTKLPRPDRQPRARVDRWAAHNEVLEAFYGCTLALARLPEEDEFDDWDRLRAAGRVSTLWKRLLATHGREEFEAAQAARREDLLVYLALNQFERRRSGASQPEHVRRDGRALWGTWSAAQAAAGQQLRAIADVGAIHAACRKAAEAGVGHLDGDHSLQFHASLAARLPALLRVYLGCATHLHGDAESVDLVKLHVGSAKVSLMTYDDFSGRAVPELIERVKINLRTQDIDFFVYDGEKYEPQPLYLKSRYLAPDMPGYDEQAAFDAELEALGAFDFRGFGPERGAFYSSLAQLNYEIDGMKLQSFPARSRKSRDEAP